MNHELIKFTIPGKPMGKQRPRVTRTGHTYTPDETTHYENLVKLAFQQAKPKGFVPTNKQLYMEVTCLMPIPISWSKKKHDQAKYGYIRPTVKPDFDNVGKIVADALNGIAYRDDSQIVDAYVRKFYAEDPGVEVTLEWDDE
jgi:Holliday junction resolvase RusA-like endonuclease